MANTVVIDELDRKIQRAKDSLFTGVLAVGKDTNVEWFLYFLVGQIVWANARTHSKRRWHRQLLKCAPELDPKALKEIPYQAQNYKTVAQLVMRKKFSREHFSKIVRGCISEILFDIIHGAMLDPSPAGASLTYKASLRNGANFPCIGLLREPVWEGVQTDWQNWQRANLTDYAPNLAPVIAQSGILQERTSSDAFQLLKKHANGQQTLRDIAVKAGYPLISLTQSLVPHIRRDLIKLVPVDDLPLGTPVQKASYPALKSPEQKILLTPTSPPLANKKASEPAVRSVAVTKAATKQFNNNSPGIVYVDDSPADSQTMADIFQGSGYRYVNIADPIQALPKLLELKPQLIFLDLVMPVVNGYELCAQIRRITALKEVPVIIMTSHNGIPDRVRAKVVGATGFLGKPIRSKQVLKVAIKYLEPTPVEPRPTPVDFRRLSPSV